MRTMLVGLAVACAALMGLGSGVARSQCVGGFGQVAGQGLPGVNGTVYAMVEWDPDGAGPEGTWLVVGGTFTVAGDVMARNIAAWDGSRWRAMGAGLAAAENLGGGGVTDLCVFNGQVYASGFFGGSGMPSSPARWNGYDWSSVPGFQTQGRMIVFNGELICGGRAFNGSTTRTIGTVPNSSIGYAAVGGELYQANGDSVYRLVNGSTWQPVLSGSNIRAIGGSDGAVLISGFFGSWAENARILRYAGGSWSPMGVQSSAYPPGSFVELNGELYAGAAVVSSVSSENRIRRWNGAAWVNAFDADAACASLLTTYRGSLVGTLPWELRTSTLAGGWPRRIEIDGCRSLSAGLVTVVGGSLNDGVQCVTEVDGEVYVGGGFRVAPSMIDKGVARLVNGRWESVGGGVDGQQERVNALRFFGGGVFAAGSFSSAGGVPARSIARWDGSAWSGIGDGLEGSVYCVAEWNGRLVAGGSFTQSGTRTVRRLAEWDGSSWNEVGGGLVWTVFSAIVYQGDLYVCGGFAIDDGAGGTTCVAKWDGAVLAPVGSISGTAYALCEHLGGLYVGGAELIDSDGQRAPVARLDAGRWTALTRQGLAANPGETPSWTVTSLCSLAGRLMAGTGSSDYTVNEPKRLLAYDGSSWRMVASGADGQLTGLLAQNDELIVVGELSNIGGKAAAGYARYTPGVESEIVRSAWIAQTPRHTGDHALVRATVRGNGALTYSWLRNGVPLTSSSAAGFSGSCADGSSCEITLDILSFRADSIGTYELRVADACGVFSGGAVLVDFNGGCNPVDIGGAGGFPGPDYRMDNNDFIVFIDRFFTGDVRADIGGSEGPGADGELDNADFITFVQEFFAGCG